MAKISRNKTRFVYLLLGVYDGYPLCDRVGQVGVALYQKHDASSVKNGVTHIKCTTRDSQVHDMQEIER